VKKKHFLLFIALAFVGVSLNAQTLDEAILTAAVQFARELPANSRVSVISFRSNSERLNDYVVNELYGAILRNRRITPVRPNQNQIFDIYRKLGAGEINREAAQNIAELLGVQYLITGSIEKIQSDYRIHFNAVNTGAEVQSWYSVTLNLQNDSRFTGLLGGAPVGAPPPQREPAASLQPPVAEDTPSVSQSEPGASAPSQQREDNPGDQLSVTPEDSPPASRTPPVRTQTVSSPASPATVRFSLGNNIIISSFEKTANYSNIEYDDNTYGATYLNPITLVLSLRFLYSMENNMRLGLGVDAAYSLVMFLIVDNDGYMTDWGSFPWYVIIGYKSAYLHIGYDFAIGALYIAPSFIIKERLLIGIPISLYGSNTHFSFSNNLDPPNTTDWRGDIFAPSSTFQAGISFQYIFGRQRR